MTETKNKTMKLLGIGLDTTTIKYKPINPHELSYDYLYTSIEANNDYIISDFIGQMPNASLIVGIDFIDNINRILFNHLYTIKRTKIDLLLIDSSCDWDNLDRSKLDDYDEISIEEIGIKNPKTISDLEKAKEKLGKLEYVAMNISPLEFNFDIINWCDQNGIKILGFNPLGGFINYPAMTSAFTTPYLLGFSANYSTITFLSGRDLYLSGESKKYMEDLIDKPSLPIYVLKKNVNRLYKPIKKVINTMLKFDDSINIGYNSPELLYDYSSLNFYLGKIKEDKVTVDDKTISTNLDKDVKTILGTSIISKDAGKEGLFAIYRYNILNYLDSVFVPSISGWKMTLTRLADNMISIKEERIVEKNKWFRKKEERIEKIFFFALLSGNTPFFCEIKNSSQKNQKP